MEASHLMQICGMGHQEWEEVHQELEKRVRARVSIDTQVGYICMIMSSICCIVYSVYVGWCFYIIVFQY